MDRALVYPSEQAADTDILNGNKFAMVGLAHLARAVLGSSTVVDGLACTPGSGLNVSVAPGSIYFLESTDGTGYGTLGTDSAQIVKQGLNKVAATLSVPAPGTAGQSINYLIEAQYQDVDSSPSVLPYFNSANPLVPYNGPSNTGSAQNTVRSGVCALQVKAGTAATTGTQTTPAADAGWTGLWVVTIANGAVSVTTGNIAQLLGAPFIPAKLPTIPSAIQTQAYTYAADTGSVNALAAAISPIPAALVAGMNVSVKIANTNTSAAVTFNLNGLGAQPVTVAGIQPGLGALAAGQIVELQWDGASWQAIGSTYRLRLSSNTNFYVNGSTGNDNNSGLTTGTAWATLQHAWNFIANQVDLNGFTATVNVANGTYATGVFATAAPLGTTAGVGAVSFVGNTGSPDSVVISTTGGNHCFFAQGGAQFSVSGMKLTAAGTNACCIVASVGGIISFQTVDFGAATNAHILASNGGFAQASGNYTITGAAAYHVLAAQCANASIAGVTATLTGTPAFSSAFAGAQQCGQVVANAYLQTGGATGSRYAANTNGVIYTAGGGASYLPGNAAGSTATGGQYV